jgi:hypothetical protein
LKFRPTDFLDDPREEVGMNALAIMPRWFRTAVMMIVMAGVTVGGMTGSAYALSRRCNALLTRLDLDYEQANFWAALANSAAADGAWDEYQHDWSMYNLWLTQGSADARVANRAHCL